MGYEQIAGLNQKEKKITDKPFMTKNLLHLKDLPISR